MPKLPDPRDTEPEPTPLQRWLIAFRDLLDEARDDLDRRAFRTLVSINLDRWSREAIEQGLDEWRRTA
jgi:hypothetical protein